MQQIFNYDTIERIEFVSFPNGVVIEIAKAIAERWPINHVELLELIKSFGYLPFVEVYTDCIVIESLKELKGVKK